MRATPALSWTSSRCRSVRPRCATAGSCGSSQQLDGMTRVSGLLDPESAAQIVTAVDAALAPRRGPRFVDPDTPPPSADEIVRDQRSQRPDHRRHVRRPGAHRHPRRRRHRARLSSPGGADPRHRPRPARTPRARQASTGSSTPSASPPIERYICESGAIPIRFDQTRHRCSMSDETSAPSPLGNASPSPPATADAGSPDATDRRRGPKRTTSPNGRGAAEPTSPTASCCADTTT